MREECRVDDGTGEEDVDDGAKGRRDAPQLFEVAEKGGESGSVERLASGVGWRRGEKLLVEKRGEKKEGRKWDVLPRSFSDSSLARRR